MMDTEFVIAVNTFLEPVLSHLLDCEPSCRVFWITLDEPDDDRDFQLPVKEVEHYVRSMAYEGFYVAVRALSHDQKNQLQILIWEEPDGQFTEPRWPPTVGSVDKDWIWKGFLGEC